jgi:apolipoprotein N-acyltransferase
LRSTLGPAEQHRRSTWVHLVFMIAVGLCYAVARLAVAFVVVVLFFYVLFTGQPNPRLKDLGLSLARYVYQIVEYLTFNTEVRPFPFDADWPSTSRELRSR